MTGRIARCGLVCALALILFAPSSAAAAPRTRAGASIARDLALGHRVVLEGVTVTGPVSLDGVDTVKHIFECHDCTFEGLVSARNVVFERTVDLSGANFEAGLDVTGARFLAPALFRGAISDDESLEAKPPCKFHRKAVFSLAVFDDLVSFGQTRFCAKTTAFHDTRFTDAAFSGTWFAGAAFERSAFRGVALFNDAHFLGHASFEEADFRLRADFARAHFEDGGDFADARFGGGASFLVAEFSVKNADEAATFQDDVAGGDLNFTFATFEGEIATFAGLVSAGSVIFRDAEFDPANGMTMSRLQVRDLVLDVDAVKAIGDRKQRITVLKTIEESAKQRDDLGTANDAHYEMRKLRSRDWGPVGHALDYVGYREAAGYLVRPSHPIIVLVAAAALVALVRMRRQRRRSRLQNPKQGAVRRGLWNVGQRCGSFTTCFFDTVAIAGPHWQGRNRTLGPWERVGVFAFRALLVCALIGLANSNPTLRQMLDSLF